MGVSHASGYDGTTVAADAATSRSTRWPVQDLLAETVNRRFARLSARTRRARQWRWDVQHRDGVIDPEEGWAAARTRRARSPQHEPLRVPERRRIGGRANDAEALAVPRRPDVARCLRGSRQLTAAPIAIGEGQSAGNRSYGGPHYGLRRRARGVHARMPGGSSARRPTSRDAEATSSPFRRVSSTSGARRRRRTSRPTRLWWRWAASSIVLARAEGFGRWARPVWRSPSTRRSGWSSHCCFRNRQRSRSLGVVSDGRRKGNPRGANDGINPASRRPRLPGMDDAILVAVTERRTIDDIDRLAEAMAV